MGKKRGQSMTQQRVLLLGQVRQQSNEQVLWSGTWGISSSTTFDKDALQAPFEYKGVYTSPTTIHFEGHFALADSPDLVRESDLHVTVSASTGEVTGQGRNSYGQYSVTGQKQGDVMHVFRDYVTLPPAPLTLEVVKSASTLDAEQLLNRMLELDAARGGWFSSPVDAEGLGLRNYRKIITHPMDLGTVRSKLSSYNAPSEILADIRLVFDNALLYNPRGSPVHKVAQEMIVLLDQHAKDAQAALVLGKRPRIPKTLYDSSEIQAKPQLAHSASSSSMPGRPPNKRGRPAKPKPAAGSEIEQLQNQFKEMKRRLNKLQKQQAKNGYDTYDPMKDAAAKVALEFSLDEDDFDGVIDSELESLMPQDDEGEEQDALAGNGATTAHHIEDALFGVETPPRRNLFESPALPPTQTKAGDADLGSPLNLLSPTTADDDM